VIIILGTAIVTLLLMFYIFCIWSTYIMFLPKPGNGTHHTQEELESNWRTNQPPILVSKPWLSTLVANYLLFYWVALILSLMLIYLNNATIGPCILAAILFIVGLYVSIRIVQSFVMMRVQKYW